MYVFTPYQAKREQYGCNTVDLAHYQNQHCSGDSKGLKLVK